MPNSSTEGLIQLVQSLTKSEKRSFKLFCNRLSSTDEIPKFIQLFDFIDKTTNYSDGFALQKLPEIKKIQLSNIKAHLYKQILVSLRLQNIHTNPDIELRESIDYADLLYHKGFYKQALKILEKARVQAKKFQKSLILIQIIEFEKKIETQYITRSIDSRSKQLTTESKEIINTIQGVVDYSNLSLQLYYLYLKVGFVRNEKDYLFVSNFFSTRLPKYRENELCFEEKVQLYTAHVWYNHITQDFLNCFRYAQKWVNLFEEYPDQKHYNKEVYLKGMHNLLSALFNLRDYKRFTENLSKIELEIPAEKDSDNVILLHKLYYFTNVINKHYLEGTFSEGLSVIPKIELFIDELDGKLDSHRILIFYYKIACLHFGSGQNKEAIKYLNLVIQFKEQSLREDIQCFARILNLIAHYELGNDDLVEYQIKSVYRFLIKMGDLHGVQKEILGFVRQLPIADHRELMKAFIRLKGKLVKLLDEPYETRAFLYLDIISWLESKIEGKSVQEIVQSKFKEEQETGKRLYFPVKKS